MSHFPLNTSACWQMLEENILPFWIDKMPDKENGGFYGRISGRNKLDKKADKSIILNSRILWTFSMAFRVIGKRSYKEMADRAYEYLVNKFYDNEHKGFYWSLSFEGVPTETKKQSYAQSFVIYSLTEYYKISREPEVLSLCKQTFEALESCGFDHTNNGYYEAKSRDWSALKDQRLSDKDMNACKSMNTHLHILEAYSNLITIWPDQNLKDRLQNLIKIFDEKIISEEGHLKLFFEDDWTVLSTNYSFGHDIECSWLYQEAVERLGDSVRERNVNEMVEKMVVAGLEGLDRDGGLMHEGSDGAIINSSKEWWPQAEALVGLVNVWKNTSNDYYLNVAQKIWQFINQKLLDPAGEWYWGLDEQGKTEVTMDKAGPWKCPYHNSRAMLELLHRLPE